MKGHDVTNDETGSFRYNNFWLGFVLMCRFW